MKENGSARVQEGRRSVSVSRGSSSVGPPGGGGGSGGGGSGSASAPTPSGGSAASDQHKCAGGCWGVLKERRGTTTRPSSRPGRLSAHLVHHSAGKPHGVPQPCQHLLLLAVAVQNYRLRLCGALGPLGRHGCNRASDREREDRSPSCRGCPAAAAWRRLRRSSALPTSPTTTPIRMPTCTAQGNAWVTAGVLQCLN